MSYIKKTRAEQKTPELSELYYNTLFENAITKTYLKLSYIENFMAKQKIPNVILFKNPGCDPF